MTDLQPANVAFYWATVFFRRLRDLGVQQVVISPGSRSTPLTLAAAAHPHLQKQVVLDERSAAFTALGIGKATNVPAVLVCTSGTALANYYPAVIEARRSGVPMILATADRPPNLRATGANQAIDQLKIFGDYPVFFHEAGEPRQAKADINRLQLLADQAMAATIEQRGPAHLNFPFRKPLEPTESFLQELAAENKEDSPSPVQQFKESYHLPRPLQELMSQAQKPVIIVGPTAPGDDLGAVGRLSEDLSIPVLSEASIESQNSIKGFGGFLRNQTLLQKLQPDLILRFGFQPTAKALEIALTKWNEADHVHFASTSAWHDATFANAKRIPWLGRPLAYDLNNSNTSASWLAAWKAAGNDYALFHNNLLDEFSELTDGTIYHHLTRQLSSDSFVAVSNSFPARDIHLFGRPPSGLPVYINRGASGIDGVTSTAVGLSAGLNRPGVLFTGDLAFLHDSNALLSQKLLNQPLAVIVINNSGGSIFRMLPIEQHPEYFSHYFETPQSVDLRQLSASHNLPYRLLDDLQALKNFDLQQWLRTHEGLSIIECKTDAQRSMDLRKQLWSY